MADKLNYVSVGDLKQFFESLDDNIPVVSAPLNRDIKTSFGIGIDENGKFGDYKGKVAVLDVSLFDAQTGRRILLVPEGTPEEPEPIKIKYNFNNFGNFMLCNGGNNIERPVEYTEDIAEEEVSDEQGNG